MSLNTNSSPVAIVSAASPFISSESAEPPPPVKPVPATPDAKASESIPPSFTDIVLAAEPLNVVPLFNSIVALSTLNALARESAEMPDNPEPSPLKAEAVTSARTALEPETITFFQLAIIILLN